jgi:hypothetical protein
MLTQLVLVLVSQNSMLGEAGESCRASADCAAPLSCVKGVCTSVEAVAPPKASVARAKEDVVAEPEAPSLFQGIHFFAAVSAGAGPSFLSVGSHQDVPFSLVGFDGRAPRVAADLRVGLLFGRFEVALDVSPNATAIIGNSASVFASARLSLGWLFKIYEREGFGVYLPLRGFLGAHYNLKSATQGTTAGGSLGVGARFGQLLVELRGGGEFMSGRWGTTFWSAASIPVTASAAFSF